ncbi:MAG TPA: hypothetical protein VK774_03385 [Solirubrobacteraceae bacterium]|nr:hypothetical protein [Solirubrobacteraceae bacterium]
MSDIAGHGAKYLTIPSSKKRYTPPKTSPVVDVLAMRSGAPIGKWAGRKQTTPAGEPAKTPNAKGSGLELPKVELPKAEAPREEASKAEAPKEESPKSEPPKEEPPAETEPPKKEAPHEEAPKEETSPSKMMVGLDAGGWDWESAVRDFSGAAKYLRSNYSNYNSDSQVKLLSKYGVHLLPVFSEGSSIGAINQAAFASKVRTWFERYGQGGTFWAGKEDLGATTAEILNEPGNPYFWSDSTNRAAYASLIETVHSALSALPHPPTLLVSYDGGYEGDNYGRALVKADPQLLKLGLGWTVHPYGGHGANSAEGNRARVTEAYADTKQPVYVTEVGWPTGTGLEPTGDSMQWSQDQQSANITSFFSWSSSLGYVRAVVYFNYADYGSNDDYGIVNSSGTTHKPSYAALAAASSKW